MSIEKQISTYPSTGRDFSPPGNFLQNISGAFLTKKDFTVTCEQLEDSSYLFDAFENGDIFPLHLIQSVIPANEELKKQTSLQDYDYELRPGKYKHTLRFDWDVAFNQIVDTYSGTDLYIIHYDGSGKLILSETGTTDTYRGVKTDSIILQKQKLFGSGAEPVYSDLDIELKYGETFKEIQLDWLPDLIDKLFVKIDILTAAPTFITFTVKYNSTNITTLTNSDITIDDTVNGEISGVLLNFVNGAYRADNFSSNIVGGCLTVDSSVYLGKTKYRVSIAVTVTNSMIWGDGNNMVFGDGNNMVFGN